MKYELFKTKNGQYVNVVTREDVFKGLIEANIFMTRNFKKGIKIKDVMRELVIAEGSKILDEDMEDAPMIVNIYALIKNKILNKRCENLNMVLNVCECMHDFSFALIDDELFETYTNGVTKDEILDRVITPGELDWSMNSEFVSELATSIFNNYNLTSDAATKEEYLKIEKEFLNSKESKKAKKSKRSK